MATTRRISMAITTEWASVTNMELLEKRKVRANDFVEGHDRLDKWMNESVVRI